MSKRKALSLATKLAAALACLLPQAERDELRARHAAPEEVISRFHQDHIVPHADDGTDDWWNINPLLVALHQEKTAKVDVPRIAKGKRLRAKEAEHQRRMAVGRDIIADLMRDADPDKITIVVTPKRPRPKPKLQSRPFSGGGRRHKKLRPPLTKVVPRRLPQG